MLTLGGIAVAIMVVILLAAVQRALAAAAAARDPRRRGVGLRSGGLPRHPAHDRHDRRPARDARRRHRLRDPDARARRGGGRPRSQRAPDPGDRAQPRAGAARRDVRRDLRVRRPALRQGPHDPRLRAPARGRDRGDLPVLDHPAVGDPRYPRAPFAHHRQGLPRRCARQDRRVPRPRAEWVRHPAGDRERRDLRVGHLGRGRPHAADRSGAMGQPGLAGHQGSERRGGGDELDERARRLRAERRRVLGRDRAVRARIHARPARLLRRRTPDGLEHRDVGRRSDHRPGRHRHRADG